MHFDDSDNEFEIDPEDYYGHDYFDYMFDDVYGLYGLDFDHSEYDDDDDDDDDDNSYKSYPPEDELNQMKRCLAICASLNQDREDGLFCDATIVVEGKTFAVHKTVLKASSSYFTAMFTGAFSEKNEQQVQIQGVSAEVFSVLLDYIYGAQVNLTFENVRDIYLAGDMLCIDALITECKHYIKNNWITANDVQSVFEMAKEFGLDEVTNEIIHQGRTHLINLMGGKDYRELSDTFLLTILEGRNTLKYLEQEMLVAKHLLEWVFYRPEERLPDAATKVFATVRFEFISGEEFAEMIKFIRSDENMVAAEVLNSFVECFEKMYQTSHQKLIDQHVMMIFPDRADSDSVTNVQIHTFGFEDWKWDNTVCQVSMMPQSFVVSKDDLYIFTNEGGIKMNLQNKHVQELPNFPEKRTMTVFSVFNNTVYMTGGFKEGTHRPLGDFLILKPSSVLWTRGITWRKSKCEASSITHGQCIYFVGGRSLNEKYNSQSQCFSFNTLNRYFHKICNLNISTSRPKLAIYNEILYVFSSDHKHTRISNVEGINLKRHELLPASAFKNLELSYPVLAVCSVKDGLLIAYSLENRNKILLALYRPDEDQGMEYMGLVTKPKVQWECRPFTHYQLLFYDRNER